MKNLICVVFSCPVYVIINFVGILSVLGGGVALYTLAVICFLYDIAFCMVKCKKIFGCKEDLCGSCPFGK